MRLFKPSGKVRKGEGSFAARASGAKCMMFSRSASGDGPTMVGVGGGVRVRHRKQPRALSRAVAEIEEARM
jgi:hypothetical protein